MVEISLNLFTAASGLMSWQDRLVKHLSSFYYHIYFSKMTNSIIIIILLISVTVSVKKCDMVNYEKRSSGELRELPQCMRCSLKCTDIALYKGLYHFAISKSGRHGKNQSRDARECNKTISMVYSKCTRRKMMSRFAARCV